MIKKPAGMSAFTLAELVVTLAIMGILAGLAVPSFVNIIRENRTTTMANELVTDLAFTRSEAIKRGLQVTIKHKGATDRVWEGGWDIFADLDADGVFNNADQLLRTRSALSGGYTLRTGGSYGQFAAYLPSGRSRGATGFGQDTFRLCSSTGDITKSRAIIINKTGRVRVEKGTSACP